jgi:hypothetical protein
MADNIFDAQRDRRIQHLQQQSVSNIVRSNPNLRSVLSRYEDAEVSRIKLLELQRLRSKKITAGERALLKAVAKSRGRRRGREPKEKKTKPAEPVKSQTQIEVDAEEKREKLRLEKVKLQQEEDFRRDRLYQERLQEANRLADQRDIARQERIQRGEIAGRERGQRQIQFEQQARLEDRRIDLQQQQIDAGVETDVLRQQTEQARIAGDVERYNLEARRAEANRDRDIAIADRQLADLRERVARDDAFRHAELQKQQQLAIEQLAVQRQENTQRVLLEQNRIDNQRAVDAERAITDREKEQTLQSGLDALGRLQTPQELPTGKGVVEDVDSSSGQIQPLDTSLKEKVQVEPEPEGTLSSQSVKSQPAKQRKFERRDIDDPTQEGVPTPGALREQPGKTPTRFEGGATEAEIRSELGSTSTQSSVREEETAPTPINRQELLADIESGTTLQSTPQEEQAIKQAYGQPEVYKPKVKTLAEVRKENPVTDIGD